MSDFQDDAPDIDDLPTGVPPHLHLGPCTMSPQREQKAIFNGGDRGRVPGSVVGSSKCALLNTQTDTNSSGRAPTRAGLTGYRRIRVSRSSKSGPNREIDNVNTRM